MSEKDRIERMFEIWVHIEDTCLSLCGLLNENEGVENPIAWAERAGEERGRWWLKLQALKAEDDVERLKREIKELQAELDEVLRKAQGGTDER